MNTRTRSPRSPLSPAALLFVAALTVGIVPAGGGAQTVVDPEPTLNGVVLEQGRAEVPVVSRVVLTNADDVQLLARRWYRSLGGESTLGEGSVLVHARILSDGTVAEVLVPATGTHHPALNGLARRLAMVMSFAPVGADGSTLGQAELGSTDYWVAQRINFRQ